MNLIRYYFTI